MTEGMKKNVLKAIQNAEVGIAKSLIRWKHKKYKMPLPGEAKLEEESRRVAERAHEVISQRGKNVWAEIRQVYGSIKEEKGERKR